jgi:hypothetical protein
LIALPSPAIRAEFIHSSFTKTVPIPYPSPLAELMTSSYPLQFSALFTLNRPQCLIFAVFVKVMCYDKKHRLWRPERAQFKFWFYLLTVGSNQPSKPQFFICKMGASHSYFVRLL